MHGLHADLQLLFHAHGDRRLIVLGVQTADPLLSRSRLGVERILVFSSRTFETGRL